MAGGCQSSCVLPLDQREQVCVSGLGTLLRCLCLVLCRWLAVRLEFLGSIIIVSAAGFAIIAVTTGRDLDEGMVGLAMSYALQITQSLNWIVRQTVEVETNIVSVERVLEYARLPSEAPEVLHRHRPPISWPASGSVNFNNYSTRYREGLDLVLKNIHLDIKPHEKIGVVGRTGAGKSSLTLALFRIIEPSEGNISIDALNTSTIGLLDLRRRLAIIPQDAALFEGTIRDNLDPGHVHDDTELWSVLGKFPPSIFSPALSLLFILNPRDSMDRWNVLLELWMWYLSAQILQAASRAEKAAG